jgi:hypothetical protein
MQIIFHLYPWWPSIFAKNPAAAIVFADTSPLGNLVEATSSNYPLLYSTSVEWMIIGSTQFTGTSEQPRS